MVGRFGGLALTAALVLAGAASAEPKDIAGVYDFASTARSADGKPVCVERWTLRPDGGFLVESGQEQVRGTWRLEHDNKDQLWLVRVGQASNGLPDCTGRRASAPLKDDRRSFYFNVDDNLLMAPPTAHGPDGSVMYQQPYARLTKTTDKP